MRILTTTKNSFIRFYSQILSTGYYKWTSKAAYIHVTIFVKFPHAFLIELPIKRVIILDVWIQRNQPDEIHRNLFQSKHVKPKEQITVSNSHRFLNIVLNNKTVLSKLLFRITKLSFRILKFRNCLGGNLKELVLKKRPMTSQLNKSHLTIYMNKAIQTQTSRMLQVIHVKLTFFTGGWPLPTPRLSSSCCYETYDLYEDRTHVLRVPNTTLLPPELTSHTTMWKINL